MDATAPASVAIPADVELEDKIVAGLTARQLVILGAAGLGLYGLFTLTRTVVALWVFAALAAPVAAGAVALALGRRDGITFDRWVLSALRHWARTRPTPKPAPAGNTGVRRPVTPPQLSARDVGAAGRLGVVDLGSAGLAAVAVASTVSFALRTPGEQEALVATFARYLHSLSAPIQLLIRARPLDLGPQIRALDQAAATLHPDALAEAAREHADYLWQLSTTHQLLCRQIVLIVREPTPPGPRRTGDALVKADRAALIGLNRRLAEAAELLAPAGITINALDADSAHAMLLSACYPLTPTETDDPADPAETGGAEDPEEIDQSEWAAPPDADTPARPQPDEPEDWPDEQTDQPRGARWDDVDDQPSDEAPWQDEQPDSWPGGTVHDPHRSGAAPRVWPT